MAPILKAPLTGSSWKGVPGTFVPFGTTVPSTIGPSSFVHSLNRRPSRPQPSVSSKTNRAVSNCATDQRGNLRDCGELTARSEFMGVL